jgi:hypothetical protein
MAKNKETSARGAGKGQKLLSGTRDQLMKDLQRVHKLFPNAEPDRDFYRKHGKYADAAWKEHFPRFKDLVAAAGLTPFEAACQYLERAAERLQQHLRQRHAEHAGDLSKKEWKKLQLTFDKIEMLLLGEDEQIKRANYAVYRLMEEEERLKPEE